MHYAIHTLIFTTLLVILSVQRRMFRIKKMRWPASSYTTSQCMSRDLTFWLHSPLKAIIFNNLRREQVWRPWKSLKCKIWICSGKNLLGQINPMQKCYFSNSTTLLNWISIKGKVSQKMLWEIQRICISRMWTLSFSPHIWLPHYQTERSASFECSWIICKL